MSSTKPQKPPIGGTILFTIAALGVALLFVYSGWWLYGTASKPTSDFYTKLGELAMQFAVVVIVGAFAKVMIDWGTSQRTRHSERVEACSEFMRRVRAMHVAVQNAKDLLNAHRSAKTWAEQSRRLMALRPEVEEISEDLKASSGLFKSDVAIVEGLEGIISYLQGAGEEYVRSHHVVDSGSKAGDSLAETIATTDMVWIRDFVAGGDAFKKNYVANLTKSKGTMRSEVYGA
jgi:hypothetical protein